MPTVNHLATTVPLTYNLYSERVLWCHVCRKRVPANAYERNGHEILQCKYCMEVLPTREPYRLYDDCTPMKAPAVRKKKHFHPKKNRG